MSIPSLLIIAGLTGHGFRTPSSDAVVSARLEMVTGEVIEAGIAGLSMDGGLSCTVGEDARRFELTDLSRIVFPGDRWAGGPSSVNSSTRAFYLAGGGLVHGDFDEGSTETAGRLGIRFGVSGRLAVPISALSAVRLSTSVRPGAEAELESRLKLSRRLKDELIVEQGTKVVVISGAVEELSSSGWAFRVGNRLQRGTCSQAYGFVLGDVGVKETGPKPALIRLLGGHVLPGRLLGGSASGALRVDVARIGEIEVGWSEVEEIVFQSSRVVHLSELAPKSLEQRSLLGLKWPMQPDRNAARGPMRMKGTEYKRGIGVHSDSSVVYSIVPEYERFMCRVGLDEAAGRSSRARFRVKLDGRTAFEAELGRADDPREVSIDLNGAERLILECGSGPDLELGDLGNWADARFILRKAAERR